MYGHQTFDPSIDLGHQSNEEKLNIVDEISNKLKQKTEEVLGNPLNPISPQIIYG